MAKIIRKSTIIRKHYQNYREGVVGEVNPHSRIPGLDPGPLPPLVPVGAVGRARLAGWVGSSTILEPVKAGGGGPGFRQGYAEGRIPGLNPGPLPPSVPQGGVGGVLRPFWNW